jgi:hypothetical protein
LAWKGHGHHKHYNRGTSRRPNWLKRSNIFGLIKASFAIFAVIGLIASVYLTFTTWSMGLFIPPIVCIAIAVSLIRYFNSDANGMKFFYDTLALGGVFLILAIFLLYQLFAPMFGMFGGINIINKENPPSTTSTPSAPSPEEEAQAREVCSYLCITKEGSEDVDEYKLIDKGSLECVCKNGKRFTTTPDYPLR